MLRTTFSKKSFLINARYVNELIDEAQVDEKTRGRMRFFARQILDALSPSNYLVTNPKALKVALETGGDSLAKGIRNLVEDIGKGRISMTDETAFEIGRNLAITPGGVIFENELIQLIQYKPLTERVYARPLVLVASAINKFYIFDLQPTNSFVRYALEQGHTVFAVSWRNVKADQGGLTWDDYLALGVMRAIDVALEVTGADRANVLGFCVGGTMVGSAAAVQASRGEDKIASLTLLATMLDFESPGEIGLLIDETGVIAREQTVGRGGILPGKELAFVFSTLRGNDLIWPYVVGNYLEGRQPDAFDILFWNADSTNLPGPMYCWFVRNTYLENRMKVPGATAQCGVPVDYSTIKRSDIRSGDARRPHRSVADGLRDHAARFRRRPLRARRKRSHRRRDQSGGPQQAQLLDRMARGREGADRWLETASEHPGSWWGDWTRWLAVHAGEFVPARTGLGNETHREIEPSPGRYVMQRSE